ncbi:MAG: hypothetical protein M1436_04650, partial [Acidobacteria bacterium]|nr:hypothetical protein [Acidobacteriota bacterium]
LKKAYRELELEESVNGDMPARKLYETAHTEAQEIDPRIKIVAQHVREADNEAYNARLDAEEIFDEAERRLSTSMARQGTRKALESWDLREKAIRKAEAAARHR